MTRDAEEKRLGRKQTERKGTNCVSQRVKAVATQAHVDDGKEHQSSKSVGALEVIHDGPAVNDGLIVLGEDGNRLVATGKDLGNVCEANRHGLVVSPL